jgi:hypothetical protein
VPAVRRPRSAAPALAGPFIRRLVAGISKGLFMRIRTRLLVSILTATAMAGIAAGGASGATLFTSSAHVTRVAVGAAASATAVAPGWRLTSGTATVNTCTGSALSFDVTQNTDVGVKLTTTGGTFSGCILPLTVTGSWTFTVSGTSAVSGTRTQWAAGIDNLAYDFGNGLYSATSLSPVIAWQPTAAAAPVCFELNAAGVVTGPLTSAGRIDTTYCLTGTSALWSLTN